MKTGYAITAALLLLTNPVWAEGSRELNSSTNPKARRVFLSYANVSAPPPAAQYGYYRITLTDSLLAQPLLYVYANVGDSICVASSALWPFPGSVANAPGSITLTKPDGSAGGFFSSAGPAPDSAGFIKPGVDSKARENAGPYGLFNGDVANGYKPLVVVADMAGCWRVQFTSPNPNTSNGQYHSSNRWPTGSTPSGLTPLAGANFEQRRDNVLISAWDVSIIRNGAIQYGRLFSEYLELSAGQSAVSGQVGENIFGFRALTRDGFRYQVNINGMNGYGFALYADNCGMQELDGQTPAYRSVISPGGGAGIPNLRIFNPLREAENAFETRHKIFFNEIDPTLPATAMKNGSVSWLNAALIPSSSVTISYTPDGTPHPLSGTATFTYPNLGVRYRLKIDLNQNGIFGDPGDYTLQSLTTPGVNNIYWDGLDSTGTPVSSAFCYDVKLEFVAGEFHFPFLDVEHNRAGLTIQRLNGSGTLPNDTVFWDDSFLPAGSPTQVDPGYIVKTPVTGTSSGAVGPLGYSPRRWETQTSPTYPAPWTPAATHAGTYGDQRYMDTWTLDTLESKVLTPFLCLVVLDLKFVDLKGMSDKGRNHLYWKINEDDQSGYFLIERALPGSAFRKIDSLPFKPGRTQFEFTDYHAPDGKSLYRIKAYCNGKQVVSQVISLHQQQSKAFISLAPNPVQSSLRVILNGLDMNSNHTLRLFNSNGQLVQSYSKIAQQDLRLNVSSLQPGLYILEWTSSKGLVLREKFMKAY